MAFGRDAAKNRFYGRLWDGVGGDTGPKLAAEQAWILFLFLGTLPVPQSLRTAFTVIGVSLSFGRESEDSPSWNAPQTPLRVAMSSAVSVKSKMAMSSLSYSEVGDAVTNGTCCWTSHRNATCAPVTL